MHTFCRFLELQVRIGLFPLETVMLALSANLDFRNMISVRNNIFILKYITLEQGELHRSRTYFKEDIALSNEIVQKT